MGTIAKLIWQQKRVTEYAIENHAFTVASCKEYLHEIGSDVNTLFKIAVRPLLFGSIGAAFDLNTLPTETLLKSCAVVVIGVMARLPAAYFSAKGNLSSKERLFVAASWIPKASVQAALSTLPLSMIKDKMGTRDNYEELVMWGSQIMSTAVIAIMITAPLGLLSIQILGPRLLSRESEQDAGSYRPKQKDNTQEIEQTCPDSA
jgi:NhaP-type Na+/H+ or K+/H+ antiporter